jgi:methyltransferase (TIGR00027 family)
MMGQAIAPEHTAVRVALWRALHVLLDSQPHVFSDSLGEKLVNEKNWQERQDMAPAFSKTMRASIVGRARLIEDLVEDQFKKGVTQYVILGAGLDTFAQRRLELSNQMQIFEIDQPGPQAWKQQRLNELKIQSPKGLHFVPVNFEAGESWMEKLVSAGFDLKKPAVIVSTGVSMYLSREANLATLKQIAKLAPQSSFAMTFLLALELLSAEEKGIMEFVMKRAKESGTPFLSLFSPDEIVKMAKECGFKEAQYVSAENIFEKYFAKRTDGLSAGHAEAFLIAKT